MVRAPSKRNGYFREVAGRRVIFLLLGLALLCCTAQISSSAIAATEELLINGAGATFPYPLYAKWAARYHLQSGLKLNYQAIGSGGGIAQIKAKTVDFGASDEPLKPEELERDGLFQFPLIMGGVVPVINVPDIAKGKVRLTPDLLADIYLGKITKWNDRRIMAVNQDLRLPDLDITVVHRADGSGTTWIFTNYLTKISPEWKDKIGIGKSVSWPTGVGGKGNEGVAGLVKKTEGSIGYVEFAYALRERLKYVQLQNRAGKFVLPTIQSFQAAAAHADWENSPAFYIVLTDQSGEKSWPIVGASYILIHKDQSNSRNIKVLLQFFEWCYKNGSDQATELHYVPIPSGVANLVLASWAKQVSAGGQPIVWK
ncbi:MAG: phosphate ABC transporter substrate-binding protein PstS [Desulfomonilaceae bacterium]